MNNLFERKAGLSLIIFAFLLVVTMLMHPSGGSIEHIMHIAGVIVVTHAIAIFSLPFGWVGFWGLTRKIGTDHFGSVLGFAMMSLGLVAAMLAGATNGLVVPIFLQHYKDATPEALAAVEPILRYGFAVNHAFDYVYTAAFCVAILCWSVSIVRTRALASWIGWFGIVLAVGTAAIFLSGVAVNNLQGLRIFISCIMLWILLIGVVLWRQKLA